jgi:hypothetical protein
LSKGATTGTVVVVVEEVVVVVVELLPEFVVGVTTAGVARTGGARFGARLNES